ncbi:MAG: NERD domain-containing protein [Anaerolineales bacterium]|nr:NERD domain-containing protein [Anaerolineales bacterium]
MRIVTDTKTIARNVAIGKYASIGGIVLLFVALLINIYALTRPENTQLILLVFATFIIGFLLSNIGGLFNFRWGRRPDRGLSDALRGLDERYTLYHYWLGAAHVLVAPSGVYTLTPKYQHGLITFEDGKWKNPGERRGFLNFFAPRDLLGNPAQEALAEVKALKNFLKKQAPEVTVEPKPLVVFMHSQAVVEAKNAPVTALHVKQLKDYIRRQPKGPTLSAATLVTLEEKLGLTKD